MSLALFRKKEDVLDKTERAISKAMDEVERAVDTGRKLQTVKPGETITQRHRLAIEHTKRELDSRILRNEEEMDRLTREYEEMMGRLKNDNGEYTLSLKAMNASLAVFDEAERKVTPTQSLWDRVHKEGRTIELVRQMFAQSMQESPEDIYAAFADHLGWNREDAKALAYALAYTPEAEKNVEA